MATAAAAAVAPLASAAAAVGRQIQTAAAVGIVLTVALASTAAYLASRPLVGSDRYGIDTNCDSTGQPGAPCTLDPRAGVMAVTPGQTRRDTIIDPGILARMQGIEIPKIANAGDSLQTAAFAVELNAFNLQADAILQVQTDGKVLPAMTFSPVVVGRGRWFKVVTGAFAKRAEAESLLTRLDRQKKLQGGEKVVRLPFAFLIDSVSAAAAPAAVPGMVASYADQGRPVYALRQPSGSAWLLVGAFESAEQAALYVESFRESGVAPALVYRKGRPF